ncbi:DNA topoisomerase IB [Nocardioides aurantiacus]|uniref:DNA topoisomerase n=1 Tax=Nocardioides aurantiacus TaxID=86796 RepID=A0A3N2CT63_9ACTN|nr:DNA topoisomerase IB [Nocardioides aurantiacus]ROR90731.1 DNA topoisomerase IB [Nocardioides aurantiacus]
MPRLRTVYPSTRGGTRRRAGKGWTFFDKDGVRITDPEEVQRLKSLAIPPAWKDVWICPWPQGHIQAVGTDDAGRRQYQYHPDWRVKRDKLKFDRVLRAAEQLPAARRAITRDLGLEGMPLERADAVAVRLLDLGYFRVGSDIYADTNGSFGLTTLEKRHVRRQGDVLHFRFVGKSGIEHSIEIDDPDILDALDSLRRRRGGTERLLAYQLEKAWKDLDSTAVNTYLSGLLEDLTAKDFRTWHATVLAAASLAASEEPGDTRRSRQRAVKSAVLEVSEYLGNTPTIAKSSYIDPRVIDLYENGTTIDPELVRKRHRSPAAKQRALEAAVLELLR